MRLVPRQLRRSKFPSKVPYYGGRLTPQVIQGMAGATPPAAAPAPTDDDHRTQLLAALGTLRSGGMVTEQEHEDIARRIVDRT